MCLHALRLGALLLAVVTPVSAQPTLTVGGSPQALVVSRAVAGWAPLSKHDEATYYSVTVSDTASIVASLDAPLPPGVTVRMRLSAPQGATSAGMVVLTTTPQTVVSRVLPGTYFGLTITYEFSATPAAGVVQAQNRQVVFEVRTGAAGAQ